MKNLNKFLGIVVIGTAIAIGMAGCSTTYQPVDVTNTMAAQINNMKLHDLEPGETVQNLYVDRTGSLTADLSKYEGGVWYRAHQDKIVSIEAVVAIINNFITITQKAQWRVEYVD
ncbi:MAG: hypothetical protein LBK61_04010 [Spirochaetaceae bacterium]|jgi:hypothetical protein|nr:hypothetical protein [Spirochaetaceae bacterium]